MTRLQLFQDALDDMKRLKSIFPSSEAVQVVIAQLEHLVDLESGKASDSSRLKHMTIGIIAAREIETMDMVIAEKLHDVSAEVREMVAVQQR